MASSLEAGIMLQAHFNGSTHKSRGDCSCFIKNAWNQVNIRRIGHSLVSYLVICFCVANPSHQMHPKACDSG